MQSRKDLKPDQRSLEAIFLNLRKQTAYKPLFSAHTIAQHTLIETPKKQ